MSGHSKWAQIKRSKGIKDVKRSSQFSKLSKDITVAVKIGGGGDPGFNPSLRIAIDKAKAGNMPNDKIKNAIEKGLGINSDGVQTVENTYEAYGPNQVAFLIDCETDNPNRTLTDIKTTLTKLGGKFLSEGSISWQFKEFGRIIIRLKDVSQMDELSLEFLDIEGIADLQTSIDKIRLLVEKNFFGEVSKKITNDYKDRVEIETLDLIKEAENKVEIEENAYDEVESFADSLDEIEEVVNIWNNAEIK